MLFEEEIIEFYKPMGSNVKRIRKKVKWRELALAEGYN